MQGLLSEPWMRLICGLMSPWVAELPYSCEAKLPLAELVPPSLPRARACGAIIAPAPAMEAVTMAVVRIFLITYLSLFAMNARTRSRLINCICAVWFRVFTRMPQCGSGLVHNWRPCKLSDR